MKIRKLLKTMVVTVILLIMCSVFFWGCDNKNTPDNQNNNVNSDLLKIVTSLEELNALSVQYNFEVDEKYNDEFFENNVVVADCFTATKYNEIIDIDITIENKNLIITRKFDYANGAASTALRRWCFLHELNRSDASGIETIETRNKFI